MILFVIVIPHYRKNGIDGERKWTFITYYKINLILP